MAIDRKTIELTGNALKAATLLEAHYKTQAEMRALVPDQAHQHDPVRFCEALVVEASVKATASVAG